MIIERISERVPILLFIGTRSELILKGANEYQYRRIMIQRITEWVPIEKNDNE